MRNSSFVTFAFVGWVALVATGSAVQQDRAEAGRELPSGPGKDILERACLSCHDLGEVTKFKGYYTRAQWRDVVQTMMDYGAPLKPGEADVLADYLAEHLGKR
jgi:virginiamycin B lyase